MEIYILIISDSRSEWTEIESVICTDKIDAQIKMQEYFNFGQNLPGIEGDNVYTDGESFDIYFEAGGRYCGKIERKTL